MKIAAQGTSVLGTDSGVREHLASAFCLHHVQVHVLELGRVNFMDEIGGRIWIKMIL